MGQTGTDWGTLCAGFQRLLMMASSSSWCAHRLHALTKPSISVIAGVRTPVSFEAGHSTRVRCLWHRKWRRAQGRSRRLARTRW